MKYTFISLLFFIITINTSSLYAQHSNIIFEKYTHDFGSIVESQEEYTYKFKFKNTGDDLLNIIDVKTSCGCTSPQYPKTAIAPGDSSFLIVNYDSYQRPGSFRKSITILTNNPDKPKTVIFIKGNVIPKSYSKIDNYPVSMGNLYFKNNSINLGKITNKAIVRDSLEIFNGWGHPMELNTHNIPEYIDVEFSSQTLEDNSSGYIYISYNANKKGSFGELFDFFQISTNDVNQPIKNIIVLSNIVYDFTNMDENDYKNAPEILIKEKNINLGKLQSKQTVSYKVEIKNQGKKALKILDYKTDCSCLKAALKTDIIKRNRKSYLELNFETSNRKGLQYFNIKLVTNDPKNPIVEIKILGDIE